MNGAQRIKAVYGFEKPDRLPRVEFSIWDEAKERWKREGWNGDMSVFMYDATRGLVNQPLNLGWTDAPLWPEYKEEIVNADGKYEYVRQRTGEIRMYPAGKRHGVMPVFVKAPVVTEEDWYYNIKARMDPQSPGRWERFEKGMALVKAEVDAGNSLFEARAIGGYMYLRSLMGPENVLYAFYDFPEMVRDMMETWLRFMEFCLVMIQDRVPFFKLFLADDIAYKNGPLISPALFEEFLMPYYKRLIEVLKGRQKEFMHVEVDTDGNPDILLPLYIKAGFNAWSPCEVAAGCDPVGMGEKYPGLVIRGGIDKRILAESIEAIKSEIDRIIPAMKKRGGYIPNCDHGVPDDVPFENYLFYRRYITSLDSY